MISSDIDFFCDFLQAAEAKVYDAERGEKEKKRIIDYKQDREALKTRDSSGLHQDHEDTPYHQDYLQAKTVEDERKTAFDKEVQMVCAYMSIPVFM